MRVERRSRLEVRYDVLRVIADGEVKPTRIMYSANLSFNPLKRILRELVEEGLVCEEPSRDDKRTEREYRLTEKGGRVLRLLDDLEGEMGLVDGTIEARLGRSRLFA